MVSCDEILNGKVKTTLNITAWALSNIAYDMMEQGTIDIEKAKKLGLLTKELDDDGSIIDSILLLSTDDLPTHDWDNKPIMCFEDICYNINTLVYVTDFSFEEICDIISKESIRIYNNLIEFGSTRQ